MLALFFDKMPNIVNKVFSSIGLISFELCIMHIYVFEHIENKLSNSFGTHISMPAILIISFVFAFILYRINCMIGLLFKSNYNAR